MSPMHSWLLLLASVLVASLQVASCEDLIWYQGTSDYYTSHNYAWQGTTDGKSTPELLLASVINQPWLVTISKTKNIIYWTDNQGVIGAWDIKNNSSYFVYRFDISNWDESSKGPALTGLDVDELNNHLYFSFNRSIYRLDLNQVNPSSLLIASYSNLVFNPRFSSSRNSLFFCLRNNFNEQGDLVQVSLSAPTTLTTLVHNTSTGSIVQQLFIDDTTNTLYYNSPGTLTMRGVSMVAPYNEVFKSIYLGTNPTFFDFNPATTTFVFSDLTFSTASVWSLGPSAPTTIYKPSYGRVTGVKLYNDTHALVAYQYPGNSANPSQGYLTLVNVNNPNDTSVLLRHFGMGKSLIFDEKKCDFYYVINHQGSSATDQRIFKKNIKAQEPSLYSNSVTINYSGMGGISLDAQKRNLIISSSLNGSNVMSYLPIDNPSTTPVRFIDSKGRSINGYVVNDKTGDIFYIAYEGNYYYIYRLEASTISKDWINNVGRQIIGPIKTVRVISMAIDSERNKFYFTNGSAIVQSNLDGSDMRTFYDLSDKQSSIRSMKWDPTSNRLYFLATPKSGWIMASVNDDGLNFISAPLNASTSNGRDIFSSISPDPYSDWVYMNAEYYQPLRIKKDGSAFESLYSYIPFYNQAESLAFDDTTNSLYYSDVNCLIKKMYLNNVIPDDPSATPFEVAWQGNDTCSYANFIHDRFNKVFWLLQSNQGKNLSFAVTPVNGGPTKQLFAFPNNVFSPFAVDPIKSNLFAYYYTVDRWGDRQNEAIVKMDLYNGTNLRTVKDFNNRNYSGFTLTAMTYDSRTSLLYYGLNANGATVLESFDPVTYQTQRLWYAKKALYIRDLKVKGSSIYIATYYGNIFAFDLKNGTATDLLVSATAISLNPDNNDIYLAASNIISSANLKNVNATKTALLTSFTIQNLVFDFVGRSAYYTNKLSIVRATPPYYYRVDLDGTNKKRMQVENSFYVPTELKQLSLVNGKFYVGNRNVDSFNIDGSGYTSIMQAMYVSGNIQYDEASQRVYWQENYGRWFFSCAVYSTKYADCRGYQLFSDMQYVITSIPQLNGFVIGKNGMAYFTTLYKNVIYQMDLDIGVSSLKVFVSDQRLSYGYGIATDKAKSALYVAVITPFLGNTSPLILRVGLDGAITTLYSNISSSSYILSADLSHC